MAEGIIGSVGVSVVPDATDFWRRFVDQTRPGAYRAGEELGRDVSRGLAAGVGTVDVNVRADTGAARAEIAALGNTADSAAGGGMRNLIIAAAALAPALIPITAVAIPALLTLGLAAKSASEQLKDGLTSEFHLLQHAAGQSLTPGIDSLIGALQKAQPELRQLVGVFGGALSGELTKFSNALSNGGLTSFIAYAKQEMPIVLDTFNHLLGLVGEIVKALTPVGNEILKEVDALAQAVTEAVKLVDALGALKPAEALVQDAQIVTGMVTDALKFAETLNTIKIPKFSFGDFSIGGGTGGGGAGGLNDFYQKYISPVGVISTGLHHLKDGFDAVFGGDTIAGQGMVTDAARATTLAAALDKAADAAAKYDNRIVAHLSTRVASAQAEDAFIAAARGVADAAKSGGTSLDVLTAKGQANRDALISAASAALGFYNAQVKAGVATTTAASTLAGDARQLELTATNAGFSKREVDALLASMGLLPSQITTRFTVDATEAYAVLNLLAAQYAQLGTPNGGATTVGSISFLPPTLQDAGALGGVIPGSGVPTPTPTPTPTPPTPTVDPASNFGASLSSFMQSVSGQLVNPITAAFNQLISSLRSSGAKLGDDFVSYLRSENDQLRATVKERDQIAHRLEQAQQHLANLQQARQSTISSVRGAVTGTFDITQTGAAGQSFGEPVTLFDIRSELAIALRNAHQFEHALKQLAKEGLNKHLVSQLAAAGPGALPQALALLSATPKQLAQINSEFRDLGATGKDLGKFVGNDLYKAGIDAADGLIKGLKSKENALEAVMRHLAKVMVDQLRNALGMHSPSRVLFDEGALAFEGYRLGIASKAAGIAGAVDGIAGKSIPNRSAYKFDGLSRAGGGSLVNGDFVNHQHFNRPVAEPASRSQIAAMRAARNALGARP